MEKLKKISKENLLSGIQEFLNDKIKIILELIIGGIILTIGAYFNKDTLIELLNYKIPIWKISIIFILFLVIFFLYTNYKFKAIHKFMKYGMEWRANIKKEKVTIKGPFCPPCQFEMTVLPFNCLMCGKKYAALNTTSIDEAKQTVEKIIEAELRSGKMLAIDWYTLNYPNSNFKVKNNGASTVKNISIQVNLEINNERRVIGTYSIEKIEPDDTIKIETNPMRDVHKILEELRLVFLLSENIGPREVEDEWGIMHKVPDFIEWIEIRKEFLCDLDVNISYELRERKKNEQSNYLLEFKFAKQSAPWGYNQYEDNCNINFHQVK